MVCINNSMSKFEQTLNKYYGLLEYASTGTFGQSGNTAINPNTSPIRPMPGTMDTGDMEQDIDKTKIRAGTPRAIAKLQLQDNEGDIRTTINKLAVGKPLTQSEQEIVAKIKDLNQIKKTGNLSPLKPEEDEETNLAKTVVSDNVETLNNPNRPRVSYAQA